MMRTVGAILTALLTCIVITQVPAAQDASPPPKGPEQPLPFSHKNHLALKLQCSTCHEMPEPGDRATFAATSTCMGCHTQVRNDSPHIQRLAASHEKGEPIPWKRVYALPDFVRFSHKQHLANKNVTCESCHGPVRELEVMAKVKDISMAACIECHKESSAPIGCTTCHEPM